MGVGAGNCQSVSRAYASLFVFFFFFSTTTSIAIALWLLGCLGASFCLRADGGGGVGGCCVCMRVCFFFLFCF